MRTQSHFLGAAAAVLVWAAAASADPLYNTNAVLTTIDGTKLDGGSMIDGYPNALEVFGFSLAVTYPNATTVGGVTTLGSARFNPLSLLTVPSPASTALVNSLVTGTPLKTVQLNVVDSVPNAGNLLRATWTFFDPYLTSFTSSTNDDHETKQEKYVFGSFTEAKYEFTSYNANGSLRGRQTVDWQFKSSGTIPSVSTTGTVPDYRLITADGDVPVAPGVVGPVTVVVPNNPTTLIASDTAGTSSFNTALHWDTNAAPASTAGNRVAGGLTLRTPVDAANLTFAGLSLTVGDGGGFAPAVLGLNNATGAIVTVNALTLNNGKVVNNGGSGGAATSVTLAGSGLGIGSAGGTLDSGATGRTLTVSTPISGDGPLTISGNGSVILTGINSFNGVTTIAGGRLRVGTGTATTVLTNDGGVVLDDNATRLELFYGQAVNSPAAQVRTILAAGYRQSDKFSTGQIRAPELTGGHVLGYRDAGQFLTVAVTLPGDADLDGGVSINDFNALAGNFGKASGQVWAGGDFDYDGGVSINDFNLLAAGFGRTLAAAGATPDWTGMLAFAASQNDLAAFQAATGVPEPAALLAPIALIAGLRRRRVG